MKRTWIVLLAVAVALAIALPAGAKKPDKPVTGFKPMACEVDEHFNVADVRNAAGTTYDVDADDVSGLFTLDLEEPEGYNETRYTVTPPVHPEDGDVLCVEVALTRGTLSDLRVRWLECQDCGLYRATGKDLRNFNNGEVFSAGLSVENWTDTDTDGKIAVAVMPKVKSDTATMTVRIGIDHPEG